MVLDLFRSKGLLAVHKESAIAQVCKVDRVDLSSILPPIAVGARCPAAPLVALLLHVNDIDGTIQCVEDSSNIGAGKQPATTAGANTSVK